MRLFLALALAGIFAALVRAEPTTGKRYGIAPDLATYPQATPKDALASVLKALEEKRVDYLLAQLADRGYTDSRVQAYGGSFEEAVKETKAKLVDDPAAARQLRRFLAEGAWQIEQASATVRLKDIPDRCVYLSKRDGRWFFENRRKPDPSKD